MPAPHLRAADADRAAVAEALGAHLSAGRLTVAEFDERVARAYAAQTYGDLDELTTDLPPVRPPAAPALPVPRTAPGPVHPAFSCGELVGRHESDAWRSWLRTGLIVLAIWAAVSLANQELLYFWPAWVIGPWGAVLLLRSVPGWIGGGRPGRQ